MESEEKIFSMLAKLDERMDTLDKNQAVMENKLNDLSRQSDRVAMMPIIKSLAVLERGVSRLNEDMHGLKEDVGGLKEDVGGLKENVGGLKEDVGGLKEDVGGLKEDVGGLKEGVVGLKEDMRDVKEDVAEMQEKLEEIGVSVNILLDWAERSQDKVKVPLLVKLE
ncbi:MAG: hypothetical protein FWG61_05775 [Firmicutes bacterium]|nr:hypothetical protein [Bacillota bacterium]